MVQYFLSFKLIFKNNKGFNFIMNVVKVLMPVLPNRWIPDKWVEKSYVDSGMQFGDDVSYIYMGECVGFENNLNKWANQEKEYAARGYRTISLDEFTKAGGYGEPIDHLIGIKRNPGEAPVLHAEIYRKIYLHQIQPAINLPKLMQGGVQSGTYISPSTEIIPKNESTEQPPLKE